MSPSLRRWAYPALLLLFVLAIYRQVLDHQFTAWDDQGYVSRNPLVLQGLSWEGIKWAFTTGSHANYHPLTWLSHMADIEVFGLWAGGHAFTNALFHTINVLLLWRLIRMLTGRATIAVVVAALFAIHPLNVEAVANISQRKSVLAMSFGLAALLAYVDYSRKGGGWRYGLSLGFAALSLLAKPLFVTFPALLLLLDYWPLGRTPRRWYQLPAKAAKGSLVGGRSTGWLPLVLEKLPFAALAVVLSLLTVKFQAAVGAMATADVDRITSLTGALASYLFYLWKMVWPADLCAFYPLPETYPAAVLPLCSAALLAISVACLWAHRRRPYLLVGWLWFSLTLVPMAGFVRVGGMSAADRYCYLPLIGVFLALVLLLDELLHAIGGVQPWLRRIGLGMGATTLVLLGIIAHRQVAFWKSTEVSFNRIVATQGEHDLLLALIGYELFARGEFDRAIPYFRRSLAVIPENKGVAANLGVALYCVGEFTEAEVWLSRALNPNRRAFPSALNASSRIAEAKGDSATAIQGYREILNQTPTFIEARKNLIRILRQEGLADEALVVVDAGLVYFPKESQLHELRADILTELGRTEEAAMARARAAAERD